MRNLEGRAWPWLMVSVLVIVLDQISKYLVTKALHYLQSIVVLPMLNLTLTYNTGASYGFLRSAGGWQIYLLSSISMLAIVLLTAWLCATSRRQIWLPLALSLLIGGASGNLLDRLRLGYVVDFIDFHIGTWHFAIFNLADSAITVGTILLMLRLFFPVKHKEVGK